MMNGSMRASLIESFPAWKVLALYRFVALENLEALKASLQARCDELQLCGTLLLAS